MGNIEVRMTIRKSTAAVVVFLALAAATGAAFAPGPAGSHTPRKIIISADGRTLTLSTTAATVGEALAEAGIAAGKPDKVFPDADTPVTDGLRVRVTRITTQTVSVDEPVLRETVRIATGSLRPGFARIMQHGLDGKRLATYKLTFADGRRVMKELAAAKVLKAAQPRIIEYGRGSSLPSRGFYSRQVMAMDATAYDPGPRSCGRYASGRTATGMRAGKGVVAVDPRVIRLGSRLYVEGYGFAVAGDTGGSIKGKRIDLGQNTYRHAKQFGRRKVVVHVID